MHYGEIALKGAKREFFEQTLIENILTQLEIKRDQVHQYKGQLVLEIDGEKIEPALNRLFSVFGVTWFSPVQICDNDLEVISGIAVEIGKSQLEETNSFAIKGHRSIKTLPYKTPDINQQVGYAVGKATRARVDLDHPDLRIHITSSEEGTYIYTKRHKGPGGLPVGTSGKVLALLSGGFDSIAAAYMLARRGANVDFLHMHAFSDSAPVLNSKINDIVSGLSKYTLSKELYLSSYTPFEVNVVGLDWRLSRYETVAFRRMMVKVAEKIADEHGYQALVMGDCLGQVASQTLENLVVVDEAVNIPIFRPLIGMDKVEIIKLVRTIGLFEAAVAEYRDCCSLLSPEPIKAAYIDTVNKLERKIDMDEIVAQIVGETEIKDVAG